MLELPAYHLADLRNLAIGLWQRVQIFLSRVGTIILALMILLWFLRAFPAPPPDATGPAIEYSIAGMIGAALAVHVRADRIQLADQHRARAGTRGARSRGQRTRHRVFACRRPARTWRMR